jgi:hypothetical protein
MPFELFSKIADDLALFSERVKVVHLYHLGEPLLNPRLPEMAAMLKNRALCREVRLTTNGLRLTPETNDKLVASGVDLIKISINGLTAEDYKSFCGVALDMDGFMGQLRHLYRVTRGTNTKIAARVTDATVKTDADLRTFKRLFEPISDYCYVEPVTRNWPGFDMPDDIMVSSDGAVAGKDRVCAYPLTHLTVFADGKVGVCCVDWRQANVIGDANTETLPQIWQGERLRSFQLAMLRGGRDALYFCRQCQAENRDDGQVSRDRRRICQRLETVK